jgi:fatty acid synthase, bacteria type
VGRLDQTFLVRHATGAPVTGPERPVIALPHGVPVERIRRIVTATIEAPRDMAAFAHASGDLNPIHRDAALAALAGLPAPIVHGQWTAAAVGARLGALRSVHARFMGPVALGASLEITADVIARHEGDEIIEAEVHSDGALVLSLTAVRPTPVTAVMFPGQGSQGRGMGMDGYGRSEAARAIWDRADAHTRAHHGFSLLEVVRNNPKRAHVLGEVIQHPGGLLNVTQFTQVALTVLSVAGVAELRETGAVSPTAAFCGHSVGEYSAISAMTDLLPLEALIDVVYQRGLTMQHFVERDAEGRSAYGMGVIRPHLAGLDDAAANALVERVAVESGAPMYVVNHNVRGRQYAVAGHVDALAALREALPAKAWVAIDGIDVPFHSPLLVAGVPAFRAVLQRCIPHDTQIENLVGRYIPNLVAQPFALTPAFVDAVVAVTGVALPELREDPVAHGRALLIELLAWQFASPVRWIETQDLLLARAERVIEVGPATAPVLGRMLKSSMRGGPHQVVVLHAELDRDAVRGNGEVIVEQAPETPAPRPMFVAPSVAADPLPAAAGVVISDQPFGVNEALRALVAIALGQPLVAADGERSLDELLGGNSARRNQVLVDLGKEFGVGAVDGAHDLPMSKLVAAIEKAASGRYTHPGVYLRAAQDAGLKDIGRSRKAASAWFEGYDLPAGRRAAVLTVLAAEGGSLEAALASYGKRVGTTFSKRVAAAAGPSASAAGEASGVAQARWHGVARAAFEAAGLDPVWVDRAALAGAQRSSPVVKATDGARFDARRHVAFTAACAWARADALRLSLALARGEAPDLSGLVRAASPALLVALDALANRADAQSAHTLRACRDEASAALESTLPWANDTALITGAGPDSIAEGVVAQLLEGGARVVVTTSRPKRARVARYKALYRAHAGRGAELHIVPLDQGNLADIDTLCAWLYSAQSEVRGANTIETKAPWRPTLCFPFGAVPAEGDPSTYDAAIVASLQVNLVGVERIVGALAREAIAHHAPAVHMVLPLSPNHGQMGRDGLYAEAKAGLEAMLPRWRSEHSHWGRGTTICGARIGWVRGTGLMKGLDGVHEAVEQALGFSTFSPSEMARALLERCTPEARLDAQQGPLVADLTGGFGGGDDLRTLISEALSQVQAAQTEIAAPSTALPYPDFAFPALPAASGEPALPLEGQVAVVGFGEVGVFGNARVRWAMERDGALHDEAALELAWLCGCVRFEKGAWVDIESGDAVAASEVFERYGLAERVGVRTLTAFDPAELVLMDEIVLEQDLRFSVPDRGHAESFRALDPERTEVLADGEGWLVIRRAGTRIRVPRVLPLDRNVAGQLPDGWDPARMGFDAAQLDSIDPVAIYNLLATADAFRSAGLALDDLDSVAHPTRVGCSQGSGIGGMRALTRLYTESRLDERRQTDVLQETLINVSAAWPAMLQYGGFGPMVNPVAACATAAISVEIGADLIRAGKADFIVAGAFDDLSAEGARGFADMKATIDAETLRTRGLEPDEASRPCDARRGGFVEAQGGGTFLLCDAQRAVHAGLPIYGIVAGAWSRTDGLQRSVPAPGPGLLSIGAGGMRGPLGTALAALGLGADDVGFVSMHGTSTDANDTNETRLHADLAQALGRTPGLPLPIVAQKALTGHAKGGAAAWQLIGALQAMADGVVPAMRNLEEPDTRLRDLTPLIYSDEALHFAPGQLKAALITSLGFGHVGAAVCVAHPDTLLSRLSADQLEAYGARRAQRAATCLRAEHAVRLGDVQPFEARTPGDPEAARARLLEDGAW